jgi:membrane-associated phospholipid phosphatase
MVHDTALARTMALEGALFGFICPDLLTLWGAITTTPVPAATEPLRDDFVGMPSGQTAP